MIEEKHHITVAKRLFWFACIILMIITFFSIKTSYEDNQEYQEYQEQAKEENNPALCENIKNIQLSSLCYQSFVENGFDCRTAAQTNTSSACLISQAVFLQNNLFCDAVLTGKKVPENLECRVSVFIQRYTNEGLSNCCHIR